VEGVLCGLTRPREKLYERINARVEKMIEAGLVEEVKRLHSRNVPRESNSINSPGYKEVYDFLEEKISFKEMIELIKRNSRRYAKRQMTWFRKEKEVRWFEVGENTAKQILEYIKSSLKIW
jgi:tRNA dimethylallyltransferase